LRLKVKRRLVVFKYSNAGKQNMHSGSDRQARIIKKTESEEAFEFSREEMSIIKSTNGKVKCKFAKLARESKLAAGINTSPIAASSLKEQLLIRILE
jgi:hypothetical protein